MAEPYNNQYTDSAAQIVPGNYASTGAPGSATAPPESAGGETIGNPVISTPYASSQVPGNMERVSVQQGDTSGMSSDSPVSGATLFGGDEASLLSTGAHQGFTGQVAHPNAG